MYGLFTGRLGTIWMAAFLLALFAGLGFALNERAGRSTLYPPESTTTNAVHAAPTDKEKPKMSTATAMFGAGCFWGVEITFRNTPGVTDALVGYSGGATANPTYQEVCTGNTGHAEVVYVKYDPEKVSYAKLLQVFFENHNPTQLNYQGPDHGTQYRSAVFTYSPEQEAEAKAMIVKLNAEKRYTKPIATVVEPAHPFYKAEEYHQRYLEKRGLASCHI